VAAAFVLLTGGYDSDYYNDSYVLDLRGLTLTSGVHSGSLQLSNSPLLPQPIEGSNFDLVQDAVLIKVSMLSLER